MRKLQIDPEFSSLISPLSETETRELEKSLKENGYKGPAIQLWNGVIVDGHNRYYLCRKNNIEFKTENIEFENREEAIKWMIRNQIARRNLTVAERIRLAEKSRPAIEKAAREKLSEGGRKGGLVSPNKPVQNFVQAKNSNDVMQRKTDSKLAEIAGVNRETYRQGKRVLDSDNQEIIDRMAKGELSVNAAYKAIVEAEKHKDAHMGTGQSEEYLQKERMMSPESQIKGADNSSEAYKMCVEAKTFKKATTNGTVDSIVLGLTNLKTILDGLVYSNLFDERDFEGYEGKQAFLSIASDIEVESIIDKLNTSVELLTECIEKIKEERGKANEES